MTRFHRHTFSGDVSSFSGDVKLTEGDFVALLQQFVCIYFRHVFGGIH